MKKRYKIFVQFKDDPKTGKKCPLLDMTLVTKPVTKKRMYEIVEQEASSVWPCSQYTFKELD